mgnify:CR=1 FL=1
MAIKFLSGQTISGTLTVSGNVQGATFNGLAINTTGVNNVANQIVRTEANGYVNFGWINSISGNHTQAITRITASNDAYLRYVTPAQFRTGVTDGFYAPSSTVSGVTSVATTNGISGGTITSTGTIQVDSTVIRTTGTQSITGNTSFYPSSTGTGYQTAAIELRSSSSGTSGTPPRIGFHWDGVVASNIAIESNGTIVIRDNPGTGYEDLKALNITATGVVYASGGNSNTWNSHTSNTGTVTSVATGNGLTGGTITTTGTLSLDRPNSQLGAVLATYGTTAGASGRVRCTAPFNTNSSKMFSIEVTLYTSYTQHNYVVSAYMYSTTNQWYSPKAIYTTTGTASPDIYVGRDGNGKAYISIANSAYTGVLVHNMTRGYTTSLANTYEPWTITIDGGNENSTSVAVSTVYTSANLPAYPSVGNGQIDGRTSGLGISGSMDATANQTGNTTFTVTSNAVEAATASTLVYRNSSADVNVRLLRANYQDQTTISGAIAYRINNSSDNYTRYCSSPSAIRTFLGVPASGDLGNYLPLAGGTMTGTLTANAQITANSTLYLKDRITLPASGLSSVSGRPAYAIYQEGGAWTHPYPDLCIAMHTGIKFGANASYNGMRFYDDYTMATQVMSINNVSDGLGAGNVYINDKLQVGTDVRSPIYYDVNDTSYYLDPNGTSNLNAGTIQGTWTMSTQKALVADDYGRGVYGLYNASRLQHMWSMGTAYNLADNGTSAGNLYGMAWSHPNAGGVAANLSNHGELLLLNGAYQAAISGSIRCITDMRTPIYYDSNNTGYYGDFASTSRTNTIDGNVFSGNISTSGDGQNNYPFRLGSDYNSYMVAAASNTWGLFWAGNAGARYGTNGNGGPGNIWSNSTNPNEFVFVGSDSTQWTVYGNNGNTWQSGYGTSASSFRAPIFYDSNNTAYYVDAGSTTNLNGLTVAGTITGTIETANKLAITGYQTNGQSFYQTSGSFAGFSGWHNYYIGNHGNGSNYYNTTIAFPFWGPPRYSRLEGGTSRGPYNFLTNENDQTIGVYLQSTTSLRAPIFYDYNNTAFYLDPSTTGTSVNVAGDVVAYASSDIRFKNNITPITNALDKLSKIGGYTFEWNEISHKETGKKDIGVVAQEVEEILPEIVQTRSNGYKAVDYQKLTALLIESVKEQQVIINDLKTRIETLENN